MTLDELKAHRRAICEALLEGKQCQLQINGEWTDSQPCNAVWTAFTNSPDFVRIKPEPRKCWVKWSSSCAENLSNLDRTGEPGWQLVEEDVK